MREAAVGNALSLDGGQPRLWHYGGTISADVDDNLSRCLLN